MPGVRDRGAPRLLGLSGVRASAPREVRLRVVVRGGVAVLSGVWGGEVRGLGGRGVSATA